MFAHLIKNATKVNIKNNPDKRILNQIFLEDEKKIFLRIVLGSFTSIIYHCALHPSEFDFKKGKV